MGPGVSLSLWSPKLYGDMVRTVALSLERNSSHGDRTPGTAQWTRQREPKLAKLLFVASPRPISTGQLHVLPRFHFRPINPVV